MLLLWAALTAAAAAAAAAAAPGASDTEVLADAWHATALFGVAASASVAPAPPTRLKPGALRAAEPGWADTAVDGGSDVSWDHVLERHRVPQPVAAVLGTLRALGSYAQTAAEVLLPPQRPSSPTRSSRAVSLATPERLAELQAALRLAEAAPTKRARAAPTTAAAAAAAAAAVAVQTGTPAATAVPSERPWVCRYPADSPPCSAGVCDADPQGFLCQRSIAEFCAARPLFAECCAAFPQPACANQTVAPECSGAGVLAAAAVPQYTCNNLTVGADEATDPDSCQISEFVLTSLCICPDDRIGKTCSEWRPIVCRTERLQPRRACAPPGDVLGWWQRPSSGVDSDPACLVVERGGTVAFEHRLNCSFAALGGSASAATLPPAALDVTLFEYLVQSAASPWLAVSRAHSPAFALRPLNTDELSDHRGTVRVVLTPAQLLGQVPISSRLRLSAVPDALFHGGRLYVEAGVELESLRGIRRNRKDRVFIDLPATEVLAMFGTFQPTPPTSNLSVVLGVVALVALVAASGFLWRQRRGQLRGPAPRR